MDTLRFLDILGFVVGLVYLILEYKASIWLWLASIIMPAIDMVLYFKAGLYADFGMAIYYCLAGVHPGSGSSTRRRSSARNGPSRVTSEATSFRRSLRSCCFGSASGGCSRTGPIPPSRWRTPSRRR